MIRALYRRTFYRRTFRRPLLATLLLMPLLQSAVSWGAEVSLTLVGSQYGIPGVLALPDRPGPVPAVLLVHGTASQKHEVGNLYARLAEKLEAAGIASLRIDFAGTGDSPVDYRAYSLTSAESDAQTALDFLSAHSSIAAERIAVLGFSQGGLIAQLLVSNNPETAALVTWSTVAANGIGSFQSLFDAHYARAKREGYAPVSFPWLDEPLNFSLAWFEELRAQQSLSAMSRFPGPVLAIAGTADTSVPYQQSLDLVAQSANPRSRALVLAGADHIFNILASSDGRPGSHAQQLLAATRDWLLGEFPAP